METVRILCVPVQECKDVEEELFLEKVNPLVDRIVGETPFKELFP